MGVTTHDSPATSVLPLYMHEVEKSLGLLSVFFSKTGVRLPQIAYRNPRTAVRGLM